MSTILSKFKFPAFFIIIVAMVVATAALTPPVMTVRAASESEMQDQIKRLEQKNRELDKLIADKNKDINAQQTVLDGYDEKIANTMEQIDLYQAKLDAIDLDITALNTQISNQQTNIRKCEAEISKLEVELQAKEDASNETRELFKERIRALYMQGEGSNITMLLGASDYSDFLFKSEIVKSVAAHDHDLMERFRLEMASIDESKNDIISQRLEIEKAISVINEKKDALLVRRDDIEVTKVNYDHKQNELTTLYNQSNEIMLGLTSDVSEAARKKAQYQKEIDATEAEIDRIYNQLPPDNGGNNGGGGNGGGNGGGGSSNGKFSAGNFLWPVPGYEGAISSGFGWRGGGFHGGTDISRSGIYGKNVVASETGTVVDVRYGNTGYGNYIMIDHGYDNGKRYTTHYGHLKDITVSKGQTVSRGQVIGHVGSTGNSTGPHLHFEIRINNEKVNPMNYF